ncbi:MAG: PDC sensor domain-containing protein [Minwuia sp.]|uniref:PDC sensor domain-containing protein n=1 Tax=Minwuia sp. TaxID=2493630 RepID=UPI003A89FE8C
MKRLSILVAAGALALAASSASANEFQGPLEDLARNQIKSIISDPSVVAAIKAQNDKHGALSQADIDGMDNEWRAEVKNGGGAMISEVLANAVSNYLKSQKDAAGGQFTEIFVMDNKGLNVGQSDVTSDYWQGDEAKWQETYQVGAESVHVSEVELDESTQTYQSQVSVPIVDPADGSVIGAATFGVDVSTL